MIDSYLLHGPTRRSGLAPADWEAWRAMEAIHDSGRARLLGVSNVTLEQLDSSCAGRRASGPASSRTGATPPGAGTATSGRSAPRNGLVYQGFSLLTANREALAHPEVARIAGRHGRTVAQVVFRFALEVGMVPLTGTTDPDHMRADLEVFDFRLEPDEVERIERIGLA